MKNWLLGLLPGIPVLGLVVVARLLGIFQLSELQALDFGLRSRPEEAPDERITIVSVTEEDIQAIGTYPIPDREIANLLTKVNQYEPRAIGLDIFRDLPVEPGHETFSALVEQLDNLVVINKILPPGTIDPPPTASDAQVGFADAVPDSDGFVRRSLLGALDSRDDQYKFSFTIRLVEKYLAAEGIVLENGIRDPSTMRFAKTELLRVLSLTGGYVRIDSGGQQVLINFRSGQNAFDMVTYQDIQSGDFSPNLLADRIVLVGITAPSVKDTINTAAISGVNPGLVTGVEVQAHAISQILSAVLDGRSLLNVLPEGGEYGWIVLWGLLGLLLAQRQAKLAYFLVSIVVLSSSLAAISYGLLIAGWWVPVVPAMVAFALNGMILYPSFQAQRSLELRLADRQQLIERTFDQIHNGPLQTLATVLTRVIDEKDIPAEVNRDLRVLNQDLRGIYESLKQEFLSVEDSLQLIGNRIVRLDQPLHEILYEVYEHTLQRPEFPYLGAIKFYIRKLEPMAEKGLNNDCKREIGRFLEEAICNVGKYAKGCSRLTVICMQKDAENVIRVVDNGCSRREYAPGKQQRTGRGTQQAMSLAKRLKGRFQRSFNEPEGTVTELRWPILRL